MRKFIVESPKLRGMSESFRFEAAGFLTGFLEAGIIDVFAVFLNDTTLAVDGLDHQIPASAKTCLTASLS
jgi:hypothetical protein